MKARLASTPRGGSQLFRREVAVCVRSRDGRVIEISTACKRLCKSRKGRICRAGCTLHFRPSSDERQETTVLRNRDIGDWRADIVVREQGASVTTVLFPLAPSEGTMTCVDLNYVSRGLSRAEAQVLSLAQAGHSNAEIGKRLGIARSTVRTHLNRIYQKWPDGRMKLSGRR